jgi:hypothetical protein
MTMFYRDPLTYCTELPGKIKLAEFFIYTVIVVIWI